MPLASKDTDFSQWYIDVVLQSKLADYGPVKGTMVIRPYGYAIWERIQSVLDKKFKETGHVNAYFPLLIPQSYLEREAEHIEGFAPETAVVTMGGNETLEEPLVIRPTSETIIWSMYKKWVQSYRDLPLLINQWANVMRWEMRTRLFLRTSEFLWQEGHTAHATEKEARNEALQMLDIYQAFAQDYLAMYVIKGVKSAKERFAGAIDSYSIEAMMQDKKALQAGTSHFLGQNFAKAFDVTFQNQQGEQELVWATSWGVSTRLLGALIMTHGDNSGLVLPPIIAPVQVVCIPIIKSTEQKAELLPRLNQLASELRRMGVSVTIDDDEQKSPGWKFSEWELRGVPIRIEYGARDMENDVFTIARRDTKQKQTVTQYKCAQIVCTELQSIQRQMFKRSRSFTEQHTMFFESQSECLEFLRQNQGYAEVHWDGERESEEFIKQHTNATSRVIIETLDAATLHRCIISGNRAKYRAIFAKNY